MFTCFRLTRRTRSILHTANSFICSLLWGEKKQRKVKFCSPVCYPSFLATFGCLVIALPGQRRAFPFLQSPAALWRGGGRCKKISGDFFIDVKWKVCRNSSRCFLYVSRLSSTRVGLRLRGAEHLWHHRTLLRVFCYEDALHQSNGEYSFHCALKDHNLEMLRVINNFISCMLNETCFFLLTSESTKINPRLMKNLCPHPSKGRK